MFSINLKKTFNHEGIIVPDIEMQPCSLIDNIPSVDEGYVFELSSLNELLLYLSHPHKDCLYISGPSGCGKTTLVLQAAARLNWGVEQVTLSNKTESIDLIGHSSLRAGELVYEYGPLSRAMLYGEILILNEIDLMSPGDLSVLNDVLDGKSLTIVENSCEVIRPHPQFRVVATANTKGFGDMTGFYNGARLLNQAFLDRFRFVEMDYPKPHVEMNLLKRNYPQLSDEVIKNLVHFAHDLREVQKQGFENGVRQLSAPFSSRSLIKIASLLSLDTGYSVHKIVKMCYALRLPSVENEYVMRLCNDIFGHEKDCRACYVKDAGEKSSDTSVSSASDSTFAQTEKIASSEEDKSKNKKKSSRAKAALKEKSDAENELLAS